MHLKTQFEHVRKVMTCLQLENIMENGSGSGFHIMSAHYGHDCIPMQDVSITLDLVSTEILRLPAVTVCLKQSGHATFAVQRPTAHALCPCPPFSHPPVEQARQQQSHKGCAMGPCRATGAGSSRIALAGKASTSTVQAWVLL